MRDGERGEAGRHISGGRRRSVGQPTGNNSGKPHTACLLCTNGPLPCPSLSLPDLPATSDLRGENDPDEMPYPMTTPIKHMGIGERTCACVGGGRASGAYFRLGKTSRARDASQAQEGSNRPLCDRIWVNDDRSQVMPRVRSLHSEGLLIQLNPNADHCDKRLNSADSQKSNSNIRFRRAVKWSGSR